MINKIENEKLLELAFYKNRLTLDSEYNYDIFPLIDDFDFYTFIDYAEKHKKNISDYGAFIVITPKQYIIGYNQNYGTGTHLSSFARVTKEIQGGGLITTKEEAINLSNYCLKNYLVGRITYECVEEFGIQKCSGYISFDIKNKQISLEEFNSFKQFYEDYNDEIKRVIIKYGKDKFNIILNIKINDKIDRIITASLDDLYIYLEQNINEKLNNDDNNEVIIGKPNKNKKLIKKSL